MPVTRRGAKPIQGTTWLGNGSVGRSANLYVFWELESFSTTSEEIKLMANARTVWNSVSFFLLLPFLIPLSVASFIAGQYEQWMLDCADIDDKKDMARVERAVAEEHKSGKVG